MASAGLPERAMILQAAGHGARSGACALCALERPHTHTRTEREMGHKEDETPDQTSTGARKGHANTWAEENASAIAERRMWIERHGAPLDDLQVLVLKE